MLREEGLMPLKRDIFYVNVCGTFRFRTCYMSIYWEISAFGYISNLQGALKCVNPKMTVLAVLIDNCFNHAQCCLDINREYKKTLEIVFFSVFMMELFLISEQSHEALP